MHTPCDTTIIKFQPEPKNCNRQSVILEDAQVLQEA